jgi:hypothetical protein
MRTTSLDLAHSAALSALFLSALLVGCGSSAMTGQQGLDAAGRDATNGAGGTSGANGGAGGSTFGTAGAGGGGGGGGHAAGGTSGVGGIIGNGGAGAAGGSLGTGGTTGGGGVGAGGNVSSGGREGTGGRSGAGGSSSIDGGVDAPSGCPAQLPISGVACQGSLACSYGQTTCCGRSSSAWTCTCSGGSFLCAQTVECNTVCPGQDAASGVDGGRPDTPPRPDVSSIDSSSLGAACGGPTDPPCTDFTYCDFPDNRCGSDMQGTCAAIPRGALCAIAPAPVCGCDGKNYAGQCQAEQAGTDVNQLGTCTPPAGMFRCGWSYCQQGSEYCSGQVGGVVTNPGSYSCKAVPAACNGTPSCGCVGGAGTFCTADAQGDVTVTLPVP